MLGHAGRRGTMQKICLRSLLLKDSHCRPPVSFSCSHRETAGHCAQHVAGGDQPDSMARHSRRVCTPRIVKLPKCACDWLTFENSACVQQLHARSKLDQL